MPTLAPILWTSPKDLLVSATHNLIRKIGKPDVYLLGHLAVQLESPLVSKEDEYLGMCMVNPKDGPDGVFKRHLGFGALGEPIFGKLEAREVIELRIQQYAKRNKLAVMRFKVHESGMRRVLRFLEYFRSKIEGTDYSPCDFYSGVMNPIYENEGAGCSSFGMTILQQADALPACSNRWKVNYNIPMNLVGGIFNNGYRVKVRDIFNSGGWFDSKQGKQNVDYINCDMYDPSMMYRWLKRLHKNSNSNYKLSVQGGVYMVEFDYSTCEVDASKPLLKKRKKENFFVEQYKKLILKK